MATRERNLTDKQRFLRRKFVEDNYEHFYEMMRYYRLNEEKFKYPERSLVWRWGEQEGFTDVINQDETEV